MNSNTHPGVAGLNTRPGNQPHYLGRAHWYSLGSPWHGTVGHPESLTLGEAGPPQAWKQGRRLRR